MEAERIVREQAKADAEAAAIPLPETPPTDTKAPTTAADHDGSSPAKPKR